MNPGQALTIMGERIETTDGVGIMVLLRQDWVVSCLHQLKIRGHKVNIGAQYVEFERSKVYVFSAAQCPQKLMGLECKWYWVQSIFDKNMLHIVEVLDTRLRGE